MREAEVGVIWETVASRRLAGEKKLYSEWLLVERTRNRFGIADPQDIVGMYEARIRNARENLSEERSAGEGIVSWCSLMSSDNERTPIPSHRRCRPGYG